MPVVPVPPEIIAHYTHDADEARRITEGFGELVGLEGLAAYLPQLAQRWADPDARSAILYSARATEREPALLGLSAHLLCVARRPYRGDE
jgi:hypothetical protein